MKLKAGQVVDCDETPHVEAESIAFGIHVAPAGPVGVVIMLSLSEKKPLVVYPMTIDEAVHQHKELGVAIEEFRLAKGGAV